MDENKTEEVLLRELVESGRGSGNGPEDVAEIVIPKGEHQC